MGGGHVVPAVGQSVGRRIAWKAAASSEAPPPPPGVRFRAAAAERAPPAAAVPRPPAACLLTLPPLRPGAKRGGGEPRRPWTAGAEQPPRSPSPLSSPTAAVPARLFALERRGKEGD